MGRTSQGTVSVAARLSVEERRSLESVARLNDRSASREIRRAVRFYLAHQDQVDEAFRRTEDGQIDDDG